MVMLRRRSLLWLAVVLTATLALSAQGAGCAGKTACVKTKGGACASPADALSSFHTSCDSSRIQSVDGEATFDGEYCCYPVTESPYDIACQDAAGGGEAVGGGDPVGGFGGGPSCLKCACSDTMANGGCADLCDQKFVDPTPPNFCNGADPLSMCAACIMTICGSDPASCN